MLNSAKTGKAIKLQVGADGALPTDVMLFKAGENPTSKGTFIYDPADADTLRAADTRDLVPIDIAHQSLSELAPSDSHKSLGWFTIDFAEDGIWARNIEWTDAGAQYLKKREFRYISPAFATDENDHIVEVVNFALTNIPATHNPLPLVADQKPMSAPSYQKESTPMSTKTRKLADGSTAPAPPSKVSPADLSPEEIQAMAEQFDQLQQENADLKAQVAELQSQLGASDAKAAEATATLEKIQKETFVGKLSRDGILKPALRDWAMSMPLDALKEYEKASRADGTKKLAKVEEKETVSDDSDKTERPLKSLTRPKTSKETK